MPRPRKAYPSLDSVLATSISPDDASVSLGISRSAVYRVLKRFGKKPPEAWTARMYATLERNKIKVPEIVVTKEVDRAWAAGLIGGDGSISANYIVRRRQTALLVIVRMTNKEWVSRFAEITQSTRPGLLNRKPPEKQMWEKVITGIRALRLLHEITPFLVGGKREEAKRAFEFFSRQVTMRA